MGRHRVWMHGWKLFLLPIFLDVPKSVKYVCAAIIFASLVIDVVLEVRKRRQRRSTEAASARDT
jgi:DMSO/TMAO reductase YedYZ heme-binding membrane subunit